MFLGRATDAPGVKQKHGNQLGTKLGNVPGQIHVYLAQKNPGPLATNTIQFAVLSWEFYFNWRLSREKPQITPEYKILGKFVDYCCLQQSQFTPQEELLYWIWVFVF